MARRVGLVQVRPDGAGSAACCLAIPGRGRRPTSPRRQWPRSATWQQEVRIRLYGAQLYVAPRLHGVTVPETVRRALRLGKRDKIRYSIRPSGEVVLSRSASSEGLEADDPVLGQILGYLARDLASHPERLQAVDAGLVERLQSLVGGIEVDLDAALSMDDA